jgi:hypothetical protein
MDLVPPRCTEQPDHHAVLNSSRTGGEIKKIQLLEARSPMLAEKFILWLEARIRSGQYLDGRRVHEFQPALNPAELPIDQGAGQYDGRRGASASTAS